MFIYIDQKQLSLKTLVIPTSQMKLQKCQRNCISAHEQQQKLSWTQFQCLKTFVIVTNGQVRCLCYQHLLSAQRRGIAAKHPRCLRQPLGMYVCVYINTCYFEKNQNIKFYEFFVFSIVHILHSRVGILLCPFSFFFWQSCCVVQAGFKCVILLLYKRY